jgi:capsular exopolysaccharide synthesis family protein
MSLGKEVSKVNDLKQDEELKPGKRQVEGDFSEGLMAAIYPDGATAEAYRTLRTNLFYSFIDNRPRTILVTSPGPGDGKSITCANLGVVLAQADKTVLILDCDLRSPAQHAIFGLRSRRGLVTVLVGEDDFHRELQEPIEGLKVLTSGPVPLNPAELLGSRGFAQLLAGAREQFDYVLLDAPPVEVVTDPVVLSTQVDGTLLVVDAQKTRQGAVRRSMRSLKSVEARILGTVMNNSGVLGGGYYGQ